MFARKTSTRKQDRKRLSRSSRFWTNLLAQSVFRAARQLTEQRSLTRRPDERTQRPPRMSRTYRLRERERQTRKRVDVEAPPSSTQGKCTHRQIYEEEEKFLLSSKLDCKREGEKPQRGDGGIEGTLVSERLLRISLPLTESDAWQQEVRGGHRLCCA